MFTFASQMTVMSPGSCSNWDGMPLKSRATSYSDGVFPTDMRVPPDQGMAAEPSACRVRMHSCSSVTLVGAKTADGVTPSTSNSDSSTGMDIGEIEQRPDYEASISIQQRSRYDSYSASTNLAASYPASNPVSTND